MFKMDADSSPSEIKKKAKRFVIRTVYHNNTKNASKSTATFTKVPAVRYSKDPSGCVVWSLGAGTSSRDVLSPVVDIVGPVQLRHTHIQGDQLRILS